VAFHEEFLSQLVGRQAVVDGRPVGKVVDALVTKADDTFPRIDALVIKTADGRRLASIADITDPNDRNRVMLKTAPAGLPPPDDDALYLVSDLFDKQIVDVDGRKVVRINDLQIASTGRGLRVVAADIGAGGLLRRLGVGRVAPGVMDRVPTSLIAWDNVAPIADKNPTLVRLAVSEGRLARLHPSELAEIITDLSARDASRFLGSLDLETAADAMEHLDSDVQRSIIEDLGTKKAADIIEEMDSDDAADLLAELPEEAQSELLAEIEPEYAGELRGLVQYDEDTAGGMMTTDYMWIYPHRTAMATIEKMREIGPETEFIYYLYVTDRAQTLLGVLSLRELLLALPTAFISKIMADDVVSVTAGTSAEDVASTIARYDLLAVPVVDEHGKILGIVTVDDAIDAILPERLANSIPHIARHRKREAANP
jgi:CBS domain-containing protein